MGVKYEMGMLMAYRNMVRAMYEIQLKDRTSQGHIKDVGFKYSKSAGCSIQCALY